MFMQRRSLEIATLLLLSTSCSTDFDDVLLRMVPQAEVEIGLHALSDTQRGDHDRVREAFHPSVSEAQRGDAEVWAELEAMLVGVDLDELALVGLNTSVTPEGRLSVVHYEAEGEMGWVQPSVRVRDGILFGVNIVPMEESLIEANSFRATDAGPRHFGLLLYGLATVLLAALASYKVLKSNIPRRRLWAVLPFVLVGRLSIAWPTGALGAQLLVLGLAPGAFVKAGPAAPWVASFGFPLFALIALRKVKRATDTPETNQPEAGAA